MSAWALPRARRRRRLSPQELSLLSIFVMLLGVLVLLATALVVRDVPQQNVPMMVVEGLGLGVIGWEAFVLYWPIVLAILRDWWES